MVDSSVFIDAGTQEKTQGGIVLSPLIAEANQAFRTDLLSITLYGSGAEGRLRETSDLNLIFVLKRFERDALKSFSLKLLFAVGDGTRSGG